MNTPDKDSNEYKQAIASWWEDLTTFERSHLKDLFNNQRNSLALTSEDIEKIWLKETALSKTVESMNILVRSIETFTEQVCSEIKIPINGHIYLINNDDMNIGDIAITKNYTGYTTEKILVKTPSTENTKKLIASNILIESVQLIISKPDKDRYVEKFNSITKFSSADMIKFHEYLDSLDGQIYYNSTKDDLLIRWRFGKRMKVVYTN